MTKRQKTSSLQALPYGSVLETKYSSWTFCQSFISTFIFPTSFQMVLLTVVDHMIELRFTCTEMSVPAFIIACAEYLRGLTADGDETIKFTCSL